MYDAGGPPIITYSRTKHTRLANLLPSLLEPDVLLQSRKRPTVFYHFKYFGKADCVLVAFEAEEDRRGSLRVVSYMPDKKQNWLEKQLSEPTSDYAEISPDNLNTATDQSQ